MDTNRNETNDFVKKFEENDKASPSEKQIFIYEYIKNLTDKQVDDVICEYSISKAITLFYSFHKIGMGFSDEEICELLKHCEKYLVVNEMVQLIFKDEVGFDNDWRDNDKGV